MGNELFMRRKLKGKARHCYWDTEQGSRVMELLSNLLRLPHLWLDGYIGNTLMIRRINFIYPLTKFSALKKELLWLKFNKIKVF